MNDFSGNWPKWIEKTASTIKNIANKVINTAKNIATKAKNAIAKANLTYTRGISSTRSIGIASITTMPSLSVDTKGNVALQFSYSWAITSLPSFGGSVGITSMVTTAPSTDKLLGESGIIGGSRYVPVEGIPIGGGADFCIVPDYVLDKAYFGRSITRGIASPSEGIWEFHAGWGNTIEIFSFNVFDVADRISSFFTG